MAESVSETVSLFRKCTEQVRTCWLMKTGLTLWRDSVAEVRRLAVRARGDKPNLTTTDERCRNAMAYELGPNVSMNRPGVGIESNQNHA